MAKTILDITNGLKSKSKGMLEAALWDIRATGYGEGAIVSNRRGAVFRVTTITFAIRDSNWAGALHITASLHGVKRLRDGSYGDHVHWIGQISDVDLALASTNSEAES